MCSVRSRVRVGLLYDKEVTHIAKQHSEAAEDERQPRDDDLRIDSAILVLLNGHKEQRPWSVHEMELEIGDRIAVIDSLARLKGAGLIHRCGDFVWISRAALAADALAI